MNGTPLPHEEPQMENPPAGVVAYYWLKTRRRTAAEARIAGWLRRGARLRRQRYAGAHRWIPKPSTCRPSGSSRRSRHRPPPECIASPSGRGRTRRRSGGFGRGAAASARARMPARPAGAAARSTQAAAGTRRPGRTRRRRRRRWARRRAHLAARAIHRAPHRGRPDLYPAGHREAGSARRTRRCYLQCLRRQLTRFV